MWAKGLGFIFFRVQGFHFAPNVEFLQKHWTKVPTKLCEGEVGWYQHCTIQACAGIVR